MLPQPLREAQVPRICEYVTLYGKRGLKLLIN